MFRLSILATVSKDFNNWGLVFYCESVALSHFLFLGNHVKPIRNTESIFKFIVYAWQQFNRLFYSCQYKTCDDEHTME